MYVEIVCKVRERNLFIIIEILLFDMGGDYEVFEILMVFRLDIFNYNIEMVCCLILRVWVWVIYDRIL